MSTRMCILDILAFIVDGGKQSRHLFPYDSRTKRGPASVATSLAFLGRRIRLTNGQDRASPGLFAKKPSNFSRINPQSCFLSGFYIKKSSNFIEINPQSRPGVWPSLFAKKSSNFSWINPQSMSPLRFFFLKKPSNFIEINPQSRPFKRAGLPPVRALYRGHGPY